MCISTRRISRYKYIDGSSLHIYHRGNPPHSRGAEEGTLRCDEWHRESRCLAAAAPFVWSPSMYSLCRFLTSPSSHRLSFVFCRLPTGSYIIHDLHIVWGWGWSTCFPSYNPQTLSSRNEAGLNVRDTIGDCIHDSCPWPYNPIIRVTIREGEGGACDKGHEQHLPCVPCCPGSWNLTAPLQRDCIVNQVSITVMEL